MMATKNLVSNLVNRVFSLLKADQPINCPFRVVSYYTEDNEYALHATKLKSSLDKWNIPNEIVAVENAGLWEHNCARKARFLREAWERSDVPIVWIDADATVEAFPTLFQGIDADFAIHKWDGWQFGSGTIYFGKSLAAFKLLEQWALRCEADPITWDQTHLQSAWCDIAATEDLKTFWLPRSYLQIFDQPEESPAVIKHWQASRTLKEDGRSSPHPQLSITERGMENRKSEKPWRTPEETFWISEGTAHIKPELGFDFPEGFDIASVLRDAVSGHWPLLEIGCGVGRIASLFSPTEYIGVDINPNAVLQARRSLVDHNIRIFDDGYAYPPAPCAMFYTVLLHVSDEALPIVLEEAVKGRKRFIISEVMDSRWRRDGNPPVFNRNPEDYILIMQDLGFQLSHVNKTPYQRYDVEPWNVGRDSRLTTLAFDIARV
ncbi:UNVERIFIED_ORG: class I SAM-dependent methyltransferase [Roseateles sp. XES5]|nr:class I SAM-dependent methyltransferase [Roseateles sp. XES5]